MKDYMISKRLESISMICVQWIGLAVQKLPDYICLMIFMFSLHIKPQISYWDDSPAYLTY